MEESYLIVSIKADWLGLPNINLQLEKSRIQLSDLMQQSDIALMHLVQNLWLAYHCLLVILSECGPLSLSLAFFCAIMVIFGQCTVIVANVTILKA